MSDTDQWEWGSPIEPPPGPCRLCATVADREGLHYVWEDTYFLAFLTVPAGEAVQAVLITKRHVDSIYALHQQLYNRFFAVARALDFPLRQAFGKDSISVKFGTIFQGHVYLNLTPSNSGEVGRAGYHVAPDDGQLSVLAESVRNIISRVKVIT